MKGPHAHTVSLAPAVVDLLRALRPHTRGLPWVFSHPTRNDKPASENAILFALAAIGFKDRHSGKGFRSVFSTLANEAALAHKKTNAVRAAYNVAGCESARRALAN